MGKQSSANELIIRIMADGQYIQDAVVRGIHDDPSSRRLSDCFKIALHACDLYHGSNPQARMAIEIWGNDCEGKDVRFCSFDLSEKGYEPDPKAYPVDIDDDAFVMASLLPTIFPED